MRKWIKAGKTISAEGTTIEYQPDTAEPITIESRRRNIPHANGVGTWPHTSYHVMHDDVELKQFYRLSDAKEYAERLLDQT